MHRRSFAGVQSAVARAQAAASTRLAAIHSSALFLPAPSSHAPAPPASTLTRPQPRILDRTHVRFFAAQAKPAANVFDRQVKLAQRRRAALDPNFASYHYLRDEVADRLVERLLEINRPFTTTVEIGCGTGAHVSKLLHGITKEVAAAAAARQASQPHSVHSSSTDSSSPPPPSTISVPDRAVIRQLHMCDACPESLRRTQEYWEAHASDIPPERTHAYHVVDEEGDLPFAPGSVDLIVSNLNMHWINDLPGFLRRCRTILKPDGVLLASMLGGSTLQELRSALTVADIERMGGVTAHVSPFAYGRDCGDLMASAGFSMPTIDTDVLTLRYPDLFTLSAHLGGMGESNCVLQRAKAVSRDVFVAAAATYESLYADDEGYLPATFQVLYMVGWSPHASQSKPAARGSATVKIGDIGKASEEMAKKKKSEQEQAAEFEMRE